MTAGRTLLRRLRKTKVTFAPHTLAADWSLAPQWAFNRWLVAAAVLLAGAMVAFL
jgi:hypothetical protein